MITVKRMYVLLLALAMLLSACAAAPTSTTPNTSTEPTKAVQETQDGTNENIEGTTVTEGSTAPEPSDPTLETDSTQPSTEVTVPTTEPPVTDPTKTPTIPTEPDETLPPVTTDPVPTDPPVTEPEPTVPPTTGSTVPPTTEPPETEPAQPSTAPTEPTVPTEPKAELKFSVSKPEVEVGKTYEAEYTYTGSKTLTWSSNNTAVATVNQNGVITGVSAGSSIIKVTDGTVTARCTVKVKAAPSVYTTSIEFYAQDGPLYDGITKYVGDYLWFLVYNYPEGGTTEINVTSSNSSVVSVSYSGNNCGLSIGTPITLNFKSAGTATITLTSGDGAVTQSYTIYVKADYDFNPGSGLLSPEEFADYATRVMCANGFTEYPCTSWRQFTLSANQLTFARAVSVGQSCVHEWWPGGDRYCQIVYVGQDEDGNYVFHECWG